ncbi:MAG: DUF2254 family protein [Singulisphaera sp.]
MLGASSATAATRSCSAPSSPPSPTACSSCGRSTAPRSTSSSRTSRSSSPCCSRSRASASSSTSSTTRPIPSRRRRSSTQSDGTSEAIDRLFPESLGRTPRRGATPAAATLPAGFDAGSRPVPATESDYLQAVDGERLLEMATEKDLVLRVEHPGRFVVEAQTWSACWPPLAWTTGSPRPSGGRSTGSRRTLTQDTGFAVDQLVEVAVRALSPGINDPFTAMACLDRLGASLSRLAGRETPSAYRFDEGGRLRVVAEVTLMAGLVDAAFHQIRQAARTNAAVTLRLLETIALSSLRPRRDVPRVAPPTRRLGPRGQPGGLLGIDRREAAERYRAIFQELGSDHPSPID